MEVTIPVTQLRTHIAAILKRLREDPRVVYRITHHREVIAELKAPEATETRPAQTADEQEIAAFIDAFLSSGSPKQKGGYQQIRRLCRTAADDLPYKSMDEAMDVIRGRRHGPGRF